MTNRLVEQLASASALSSRARLPEIEAHDARLGHRFEREARPFSADATQLRAAERHDIEAVIGRVVHDDAADREALNRRKRVLETVA